MKQHIAVEQFLELKLILNDAEEPNEFWRYDLEKYGIYVDNSSDEFITEQFNIGKMVEILKRFLPTITFYEFSSIVEIIPKNKADKPNYLVVEFEKEELVDALWEAVKYIIKEDL
jgi:hypothetical protein